MTFYEEMRAIFRGLHHEQFVFVQETDLADRDDFCLTVDELYTKGELKWKKRADTRKAI